MDTERNHLPFGVFYGETYSYEENVQEPLPKLVIPKISFALPIEIEKPKE